MLRFLDGNSGVKSVAKDMHVHMWVNKCLQGLPSVHMLSPPQLNGRVPTQHSSAAAFVRSQNDRNARSDTFLAGVRQG